MKDKIIAWLMNLGERMFRFTRTVVARAYSEFGDDALEIVTQVAVAYGKSKTGGAKFDIAKEMLKAAQPKLATVADWLVDSVVQMAYGEYMSRQAEKDTDGDGVPDYRDMCKNLGKELSGCVDENGCPDMDCDGKVDEEKAITN